jgi:hypothetical protein
VSGSSERKDLWSDLFAALLADVRSIAREIVLASQSAFPSYAAVATEWLDTGFEYGAEQILKAARDGTPTDGAEEFAAIGAAQAVQGVALADLLSTWQLALEIYLRRADEVGRRIGAGPPQSLRFLRAVSAALEEALRYVAEGHRRTELERAREEHDRTSNFVRGVLLGSMPLAEIRDYAVAHDLPVEAEYVPIRARAGRPTPLWRMERLLGFSSGPSAANRLSTSLSGDFAGFLPTRPCPAPEVTVGVGPPRRLEHLADSFRLATRALDTAVAFRLVGVHNIGSLGLRAAIVADRDVGVELSQRYVSVLGERSKGADVINSVRAYFAHGQKVDAAAASLHIHPNTMRYRLARFEELTGADLADAMTAHEVWWALEWASLMTPEVEPGPPS